jgi:hypothetical protein
VCGGVASHLQSKRNRKKGGGERKNPQLGNESEGCGYEDEGQSNLEAILKSQFPKFHIYKVTIEDF